MSNTFDELTVLEQGERVAGCQYWQDRAASDPEALAHHLHLDVLIADERESWLARYRQVMAG